MKKRYIYSSILAVISFIILYLILDFGLLLSLPIVILIYVGGIFLYKEKDIRKYDPNAMLHYCYLISKIDNYTNLIKDKDIKKNIKDISTKSEKIVVMLEQKPDKVTQVYDAFDFYLPKTIQILDLYISLTEKETKTKDEEKFMNEINDTLDYIESVIVKLLENMNYTKMMDIKASIEMFKSSNKNINEKIVEKGSDENV